MRPKGLAGVPIFPDAFTVPADGSTPGLLLRAWQRSDAPALVAAHRDPQMRRWLRSSITGIEDAYRMIEARAADRRAGRAYSFAVVPADSADGEEVLGGVVVRGLGGEESTSGEVGYWVTPAARGQGIASRALAAVSQRAFRLPRAKRLERLKLIHAVGNEPSCRVADKAGFPLSAVLPPLPPEFPGDGHLHVRMAS